MFTRSSDSRKESEKKAKNCVLQGDHICPDLDERLGVIQETLIGLLGNDHLGTM